MENLIKNSQAAETLLVYHYELPGKEGTPNHVERLTTITKGNVYSQKAFQTSALIRGR
jgi:hypothetical protein